MKISDNKVATVILLIIGLGFIVLQCVGCADPTATGGSVESSMSTDTVIAPIINASGTANNVQAEKTIADVLLYILDNIFCRIMGVSLFLAWLTGNLAPHKNFSLWDKKEK